jgi:hypothetical protein
VLMPVIATPVVTVGMSAIAGVRVAMVVCVAAAHAGVSSLARPATPGAWAATIVK